MTVEGCGCGYCVWRAAGHEQALIDAYALYVGDGPYVADSTPPDAPRPVLVLPE